MITGLDKLMRELKEAERALAVLDGDLLTVTIDPDDPASVRRAISDMERAVDQKVSRWRRNQLVVALAASMKDGFRAAIRKRARNALG